jgi:protein tyrosine phosphatase
MSGSPSICASPNFTFPSKDLDYFSSVTLQKFSHPKVKHSANGHKNHNDSISSITSNTSDLTIYDGKSNHTFSDSSVSADTLVDDGDSRKIHKNFHFNLKRPNKSLSASLTTASEFDDPVFTTKATSAIEPTFKLEEGQETPFDNLMAQENSNLLHPSTAAYPNSGYPSNSSNPFNSASSNSSNSTSPDLVRQQRLSLTSSYSALHIPPHKQLKKQLTASDISGSMKYDLLKRLHSIPSVTYKGQIETLASTHKISYLSNDELASLSSTLIIDIRPFTDYVRSHMKSAINVCLPSTLLKRPNFTLQRCINSLPAYERTRFNEFFANTDGSILIYDNIENSSGLFHICNKFVSSPIFTESNSTINLMQTNLLEIEKEFPQLFECGTAPTAPVPGDQSSSQCQVNNILPQLVVEGGASKTELSPYNSLEFASSTPILSNFTLPKPQAAVFKIRHNEELTDNENPFDRSLKSSALLSNTSKLFRLQVFPEDHSRLPDWFKSSIFMDNSTQQSNKISDDFYALEKFEQKRLIKALSLNSCVTSPLSDETAPTISRGIEYGHKNRYKDIFLYEHSRVKLNEVDSPTDDDYINASYLDPICNLDELTNVTPNLMSNLKFIATQGPLKQTIGDFWKCIINFKVPLIISLTDEVENGVLKCSPFWKSGVYLSNQDVIEVKLEETLQVNEYLIIRLFSSSLNKGSVTHTFQIHLLSWPDMGTVLRPLDLIQLIELKHYILNRLNLGDDSPYPTVIHCSAGCGRTGTLCTIDTVISVLKNNSDKNLKFDPVYQIVNNFRRQRISMVQNLRQYYLVYEVVLNYLCEGNVGSEDKGEKGLWKDLTKLDIVKRFIEGYY